MAHKLVERVAIRFSASGTEKHLKGPSRLGVLDDVWEMYRTSYKAIGMHVPSASGLLEYDHWEVFYGSSGKPVAFNLYRTTPLGLKTGLLGSDGSAEGKGIIKSHIPSRFKRPGVYGEVSHAVEKLSRGAPVVCAVNVPEVIGKTIVPLEDGVHYMRDLPGVGMVTKKLVGNPRGGLSRPEGSCPIPDNPGQPLSPDQARLATGVTLSQELELAEHASCIGWED